MIQM